MRKNLQSMLPDLAPEARAWGSNLDEYEIRYRAPLIAFSGRIIDSVRPELRRVEILAAVESEVFGKNIRELKILNP